MANRSDVRDSESARSVDDRLDELLLAWEESCAAGKPLTPDELCRDDSELAAALAREIERLQAIDRFILATPEWHVADAPHGTTQAPEDTAFPTFSDYEVLEELGRGGMGVVYKARQQKLSRLVAIKTLAGNRWGQPGFVARLKQEAQALSRMKHRHVVQVFDVIETPHAVSLVLEYVDGESLAKRRNGAPVPPQEAAQIAMTLAETLAAVHAAGLLHRDIKPANVLIGRNGDIKISDFGLAKDAETNDGLTATGDILGSPGYMAPEQAEGRTAAIDVRTDIYALGATLYETLTGRPPFVGGSVIETLDQVRHSDPVAPRLLNPGVSHDLETICLKCLEKDAARRFSTAQELSDELGRYLRGDPIHSRPIGRIDRALRWCRRRPAIAGLAALAAAAAIVSVALFVARQRDLTAYNRDLTHANEELEAAAISARRLQSIAEDHERQAKDALYAADMSRAAVAWRDEDTRGLTELLERHIPSAREPDRRGFEWWYFRRKAHPARKIMLDTRSPQYVIACSPDGRRMASAGKDAVVRLFDPQSGALSMEIVTGQIEVNGMAFAPNGRELGTAGDDGTIRIWDLASGAELRKWSAHPGKAFELRYTSDGAHIVSCGDNPVIRVFDAQSGVTVQKLLGHTHDVQALILSPDGKALASSSQDKTARVWDLATGRLTHEFTSSSPVGPVVFLRDQNRLVIGNDDGLCQTIDLPTRHAVSVARHLDRVGALALHPGGELIAVGDRSGKIRIRKIDSQGKLGDDRFQPWQAHAGNVFALAWTDDGSRLFSAGQGGRVISWSLDAVSRETGPESINAESVAAFCLIPRTRSLLTVSRKPHLLARWNWSDRVREELMTGEAGDLGPDLDDVQVSPDGQFVAFRRASFNLHVFSLDRIFNQPAAEAAIATWSPGGLMRAPCFSPDSATIAVPIHDDPGGGQPPDYSVWQFGPPNFQTSFRIPVRGAKVMAFGPGGRRLALSRDTGIVLWDSSERSALWEIAQTELCHYMAVSPDEQFLAAGGNNRLVVLRNLADGTVRHQLSNHRAPVSGIAFAPDSATLATAATDGVIKLWHVATGQELFELKGAGGSCRGLEFADDGRHLLALVTRESGGEDILIWSAAEDAEAVK